MKLHRLLKFFATSLLSLVSRQRGYTSSSTPTNLNYLSGVSLSVEEDSQKHRLQNYIFDQVGSSADPLIVMLARTPIHAQYATMMKAQKQGLCQIQWNQKYMSPEHLRLFVLLHRLGLRGRPWQ